MTSGNFSLHLVETITVDRAQRQRRVLTGIDELADSIKRNGLINPLVVTKDGVLVAGERRLSAIRSLGWTHVVVQWAEDLDPLQLQLLELEENTKRTDLEWQDKCNAVARYHHLRGQGRPEWTHNETAEALGTSRTLVQQYLLVADEIAAANPDVLAAPQFSVARGISQRRQARAKASALNDLAPNPKEPSDECHAPILHTDFHEWSHLHRGDKFNFIHCDFPYGIGADQHDQGNAAARGGFDDTADTYYKLIESFGANLDNFCEESAHVMFWFSMDYYDFTLDALGAMGFVVLRHPLVWLRSDNTGILSDPRRQPRRIYETALLAVRGDRHLVKPVANAFTSPSVKTIHMSEKPRPVLSHFFRMFVDEYSTVLDPTCGSANALRVAEEMGASRVLGLERDEEFYTLSVENYYAS